MTQTLMEVAPAKEERRVARPLSVLADLIKEDLASGQEHYRAAGEKLIEAKAQLGHGKFSKWVEENFEIGHRQATNYMALAAKNQTGIIIPLSKINNPRYAPKPKQAKSSKAAAQTDVVVVKQGEKERTKEAKLNRALALELIEAGFKSLASQLHPDKGGSSDKMARLNDVREQLILCAEEVG